MNHSELSHMAGAVDDSTINIVEVIIIIIILLYVIVIGHERDFSPLGITTLFDTKYLPNSNGKTRRSAITAHQQQRHNFQPKTRHYLRHDVR